MKPHSPAELTAAAADWLSRRDLGFTEIEAQEFAEWEAVPEHAAALKRLEPAWEAANRPRRENAAESLRDRVDLVRRRRSRRRFAVFGGALAAAAAIAIAALYVRPTVPREAVSTVASRPNQRALEDGSVVQLNAGAEIEVAYSSAVRSVRLISGEALFEVAKKPDCPFVVEAGGVTVRALGTAFNLRKGDGRLELVVTEGRVAVERIPAASRGVPQNVSEAEPVLVGAGGALTILTGPGAPALPAPRDASTEELALSWRSRRVEFSGTPLREAVDYFNRGNRLQIELAGAEVQDLQISGVFWTDDPEAFTRNLENSLGLKAWTDGARRIVLRTGRR